VARQEKGIQVCPGLARTPLGTLFNGGGHGIGCYGFNGGGLDSVLRLGLAGAIDPPARVRPVHEDEIVSPSEMLAIGDANIGSIITQPGKGWAEELISPNIPTAGDVNFTRNTVKRPHAGRWNLVLCDGHVQTLTTNQLFDIRKDPVRMLWNRDNQPHREIPVAVMGPPG
jgi:prepilin-type processing-associated H-X9-DG protein